MTDPAAAQPRYLRIADWLRRRIDDGRYAPLERIPSEMSLARRFDVSRETVRSALERLTAEGYLFRRPGKGTFVAAKRIDHTGSTQASLSATLRALGLAHSTRVILAELRPCGHHVARALGVEGGSEVVTIHRLRLIEDEPIAVHTTSLLPQFQAVLDYDLTGSLQEVLRDASVPIVASRDSLQAVHADEDDARLLDVPVASPLLRIEGVGVDAAGRALRHTDSLHRGDRFRIIHDTRTPSGIRWEVTSGI